MSSNAPSKSWAKYKRARTRKPRLHVDLENMVLNTFKDLRDPQDLTWLWIAGRHVSKNFRCEIERMFRIDILPDIVIRCDMGWHLMCWDIFEPTFRFPNYLGCSTGESTGKDYEDPRFTLDHFSDDLTRAFFKCAEDNTREGLVFRRLHEKQLVRAPIFSIQVREVVNDTGLPELQIDDGKEEISFDWRGMLDQLMGEEHVFNTILSQRLGWHLESEGDHPNILETHRKLARRSRLQRECRAKYGTNILDHYVHEEKQALEYLPQLRLAASGYESAYDDKGDKNNPNIYTKQQILDELSNDAIIYSGNGNPSREPGSIPRGIFTDHDYCRGKNRWKLLPPPSAVDLFSPRPLPDLSWGRRRLDPQPKAKHKLIPSHGKRAREEDPVIPILKRSKSGSK